MHIHLHAWDPDDQRECPEPIICQNLNYSGLYDDHFQFCGTAHGVCSNTDYELRIPFETIVQMVKELSTKVGEAISGSDLPEAKE